MNAIMNENYLFLAFGSSYIDDTVDLVSTIRHFKDDRDCNVVVKSSDHEYAKSKNIFSKIIIFDPEKDPLFGSCTTDFEKYCLLPRLSLPKFLVSYYTLILDVDMLCISSTNKVWSFLKDKDQPLSMGGSTVRNEWHWGYWGEIAKKLNIHPYETSGALFFIKNEQDKLEPIFKSVAEAFINYDHFGMLRQHVDAHTRGAPYWVDDGVNTQNLGTIDECCFSYAFSKNDLKPIDFLDFPILTFDLDYDDEIPTKEVKTPSVCSGFAGREKTMEDYVPFVHMVTNKNNTSVYKDFKNKILQTNYV